MNRETIQSEKISQTLIGRTGLKARRWKGMDAGYVAKHMWIKKHHGKASRCEHCFTDRAKRYEWANISGKYLREVSDYKQLCPSCHRKWDFGNICRKGHWFTKDNTRITKQGWRSCRECHRIYQNIWIKKQNAKQNNKI